MGSPYVGEIRMFGGNFAPSGWAFCDGSLQSIANNTVLFQLIGTTYGGDGVSTFALPDLRSRVPVHMGILSGVSTYPLGQNGGFESVTLTTAQIPAHGHVPMADANAATLTGPQNNTWAASNNYDQFAPPAAVAMKSGAIGSAGGNQPHDNMLPFLTINFIISLFGIFPTP